MPNFVDEEEPAAPQSRSVLPGIPRTPTLLPGEDTRIAQQSTMQSVRAPQLSPEQQSSETAAQPPEPGVLGSLGRGAMAGLHAIPELVGSAVEVAGKALELPGMEAWGQETAAGQRKVIQEQFAPAAGSATIQEALSGDSALDDVGRTANWAAYNFANLAAQVVPFGAGEFVGATAGKLAARAVIGSAARKALAHYETLPALNAGQAALAAKLADQIGTTGSVGAKAAESALGAGLGVGGVNEAIKEQTGEVRPDLALGYGIPAGLAMTMLPGRVLSTLAGETAQKGLARNVLEGAGIGAATLPTIGAANRMAAEHAQDFQPGWESRVFDPKLLAEEIAVGGLGGGLNLVAGLFPKRGAQQKGEVPLFQPHEVEAQNWLRSNVPGIDVWERNVPVENVVLESGGPTNAETLRSDTGQVRGQFESGQPQVQLLPEQGGGNRELAAEEGGLAPNARFDTGLVPKSLAEQLTAEEIRNGETEQQRSLGPGGEIRGPGTETFPTGREQPSGGGGEYWQKEIRPGEIPAVVREGPESFANERQGTTNLEEQQRSFGEQQRSLEELQRSLEEQQRGLQETQGTAPTETAKPTAVEGQVSVEPTTQVGSAKPVLSEPVLETAKSELKVLRTPAEVEKELEGFFTPRRWRQIKESGLIQVVDDAEAERLGMPPEQDGRFGMETGNVVVRANARDGVLAALLHEGEHAGMEVLLGKSYGAIQRQFARSLQGGDATAAKAEKWAQIGVNRWKAANPEADVGMAEKVLAKERLAYFVQEATRGDIQEPRGLFQRIVDATKAWFRQSAMGIAFAKRGVSPELTDGMAVELAKRATVLAADVRHLEKSALGEAAGPKAKEKALETFAGRFARTLPQDKFAEAKQLAKGGGITSLPGEIYTRTGMWKLKDGLWRFEINDSKAVLKKKGAELQSALEKGATLKDLLDHDELFAAYPDLKDVDVVWDKNARNWAQEGGTDTIYAPRDVASETDDSVLSALLHEIQHSIQDREGFARGTSPKSNLAKNWTKKQIANEKFMEEKLEAGVTLREVIAPILQKRKEFLKREGVSKHVAEKFWDANPQYKEIYSAAITRYKDALEKAAQNAGLPNGRQSFIDGMEFYRRTLGELESFVVERRKNRLPEDRSLPSPQTQIEGLVPRANHIVIQPNARGESEVVAAKPAWPAREKILETVRKDFFPDIPEEKLKEQAQSFTDEISRLKSQYEGAPEEQKDDLGFRIRQKEWMLSQINDVMANRPIARKYEELLPAHQAEPGIAEQAEARGNKLVYRLVRNYDEAREILAAIERGKPESGFRAASIVDGHAAGTKLRAVNRAEAKGAIPVFTSPYPTVPKLYDEGAGMMVAIEYKPEGDIYVSSRAGQTQGGAFSATFPDAEHVIDARSIVAVKLLSREQEQALQEATAFFKEQSVRGAFRNAYRDKDAELVAANVEESRNLRPLKTTLGRPFTEVPVDLGNGLSVMKGQRVRLTTGGTGIVTEFRKGNERWPNRFAITRGFKGELPQLTPQEATRAEEYGNPIEMMRKGKLLNLQSEDIAAVWDTKTRKWIEAAAKPVEPAKPEIVAQENAAQPRPEKFLESAGPATDVAETDLSELTRKIRTQERTLWDKSNTVIQRWTRPGGLFKKFAPGAHEEQARFYAAQTQLDAEVERRNATLEHAVLRHTGVSRWTDVPAEYLSEVDKALRGDATAQIGDDVKPVVLAQRRFVDSLSKQYVDILRRQLQQQIEEHTTPQGEFTPTPELLTKALLMRTITANVGEYLNRSFRVFQQKGRGLLKPWFQTVPQDKLEAAIRFVMREKDFTAEQAASSINNLLTDMGKSAAFSLEEWIQSTPLGKRDLSILEHKKQIPQPILDVMGVHTDPRINFAATAQKQIRLVTSTLFLERLKDIGAKAEWLFDPRDEKFAAGKEAIPVWASQTIKGGQGYSPLAGLRTSPEVVQALRDATDIMRWPDFLEGMVRISSAIKTTKTIYSPLPTAARNYVSSTLALFANADFNFAGFREAWDAAREYILDKDLGRKHQRLQHIAKLGVSLDNPYAGETRELMRDIQQDDTLLFDKQVKSKVGMEIPRLMWRVTEPFRKGMTRLYQFGDDMVKITAFKNLEKSLEKYIGERTRKEYEGAFANSDGLTNERIGKVELLQKPEGWGIFDAYGRNVTEAETLWRTKDEAKDAARDVLAKWHIENEAAERIRNTYMTYSMVGRLPQFLRKFPLTGTFVSFPAEVIRTVANMLHYMRKDFADPELRPMAIRRMLGFATVAALPYSVQILMQAINGISDDEIEAGRSAAARWNKLSTLIPVGRRPDGTPEYMDFGYVDLYSWWRLLPNALMSKDIPEKKLQYLAEDLLTPFFGMDITWNAVAEILRNQQNNENKSPVYDPAASAKEQVESIAYHIYKTVAPTTLLQFEKTARAIAGQTKSSGEPFNLVEEALAFGGWRTVHPTARTALWYGRFESEQRLHQASEMLSRKLASPDPIDVEDLRSAYEQAQADRAFAFRVMLQKVDAARQLGMGELEVRRTLRSLNVGQQYIPALLRGEVPVWHPDTRLFQTPIEKGKVLFSPEAQERIRQRRRMVFQWMREDVKKSRIERGQAQVQE